MAKYLHVTVRDNDFRHELEYACENMYEMFQMENHFPTEEDFPALKHIFSHMIYSFYQSINVLRWGEFSLERMAYNLTYFTPNLEFVEFENIPDWDNSESCYIPMFDDADVLLR